MKLFSKRNATLDQLKERLTHLEVMRIDAQIALDAALIDRQNHLIEGDVNDVSVTEALQTRLEAAKSMLPGLDDAMATLGIQIRDKEAAIAKEQGRARAEADAKALAAVIANVKGALPAWLATAREMSELLGTLNNFHFQAGGVANYLSAVANESEVGLKVVLDDLSAAVAPIANGVQKITIGKAPAVAGDAVTPAAPPKDVFTYSSPVHAPIYRAPLKDTGQ